MPRWNRYKGRADSHTVYEYHDLGTQETLVQTSNNSSHHFQSLIDAKGSYQVVKENCTVEFNGPTPSSAMATTTSPTASTA